MGNLTAKQLEALSQRTGFSTQDCRFFAERFRQLDQSSAHNATTIGEEDVIRALPGAGPFPRRLFNVAEELFGTRKITFEQFLDVLAVFRPEAPLEKRAKALAAMLRDDSTGTSHGDKVTLQDLTAACRLAWSQDNPQFAIDAQRATNLLNGYEAPTAPPGPGQPAPPPPPTGFTAAQLARFLAAPTAPPYYLRPVPTHLRYPMTPLPPPTPADGTRAAAAQNFPPPPSAPSAAAPGSAAASASAPEGQGAMAPPPQARVRTPVPRPPSATSGGQNTAVAAGSAPTAVPVVPRPSSRAVGSVGSGDAGAGASAPQPVPPGTPSRRPA